MLLILCLVSIVNLAVDSLSQPSNPPPSSRHILCLILSMAAKQDRDPMLHISDLLTWVESCSHSPWRTIDPEASHSDLRVLQVDAVGEQRLDILIILRLQLGGWREVVEVLFNEVCHELLVKGQLMVPSNHYFDVVGQSTWVRREKY